MAKQSKGPVQLRIRWGPFSFSLMDDPPTLSAVLAEAAAVARKRKGPHWTHSRYHNELVTEWQHPLQARPLAELSGFPAVSPHPLAEQLLTVCLGLRLSCALHLHLGHNNDTTLVAVRVSLVKYFEDTYHFAFDGYQLYADGRIGEPYIGVPFGGTHVSRDASCSWRDLQGEWQPATPDGAPWPKSADERALHLTVAKGRCFASYADYVDSLHDAPAQP